jgi:hypothetical protein
MQHIARGRFDVKLTPLANDKVAGVTLGRMIIEKQFHGDLEGTSRVEMLSAVTDVAGSAGYVAIERLTGTLCGLPGGFVLQHSGTMTRGESRLLINVVPDSGVQQLAGLSGTMSVSVVGGVHRYEFQYAIEDSG